MAKKSSKSKRVAGRTRKKKSVISAEKILADVPAEKCFWANNGWIIRNIQELPIALENMSDETFVYHCNREKNDFYNWIRDVIDYKELAEDIKNSKTRSAMIKKVKKAIRVLKK